MSETGGTEKISFTVVRKLSTLPQKTLHPVVALALGLVIATAIQFWLKSPYSLGVLGNCTLLVVLMIGFSAALWQSRRKLRRESGNLNPYFDLDARIQVYGNSTELSPLVELPDASFEPVIVQRLYSEVSLWKLLLMALPLTILINLIFRINIAIDFQIGITIIWLFYCWRPIYYRIVPGWMDVLQSTMFSSRTKLLSHWNLSECNIRVDFGAQEAMLARKNHTFTAVKLTGLSEPHRFVAALLQAAICTHLVPPLPNDSLLG